MQPVIFHDCGRDDESVVTVSVGAETITPLQRRYLVEALNNLNLRLLDTPPGGNPAYAAILSPQSLATNSEAP